MPVADDLIRYAVKLARGTRPKEEGASGFVKEYVAWGAGPRASQYLILGAKARALLEGRYAVSAQDVRAVALPILRHRVLTNFHAEAQRITTADVLTRLLETISV